MNIDQLAIVLESKISTIFPRSRALVVVQNGLTGNRFLSIRFTIGNGPGEWPNGIAENDHGRHVFHVYSNENGETYTAEKLTGFLTVQPENNHMVYGSVKIPWRKTTGDSEKMVKVFVAYFQKLRDTINDQGTKLVPSMADFIRDKARDTLQDARDNLAHVEKMQGA